MYDAPPAPRLDAPAEGASTGLTSDAIERTLADFRGWLGEFGTTEVPPAAPVFDLFGLVSQFTALRHEVNLQTKATRAAVEQLPTAAEPPEAVDVGPLLKAFVDVYDALATAHRHVQKLADGAMDHAAALAGPPLPPVPDALVAIAERQPARPGFFARMFGAPLAPDDSAITAWLVAVTDAEATRAAVMASAADKLGGLFAGVADGYALSLRRIDRALPAFGLAPFASVGEPFDAERMEVLEVVGDARQPSGTVLAEVRRGYERDGRLFRYAQVHVAR